MVLRKIADLANFSQESFIVRIDSDVKVENGEIVDDFRLKTSLSTIEFIRNGGGKIILVGHRGRPTPQSGEFQISNFKFSNNYKEEFSLYPVANWFAKEFDGKVEEIRLGEFDGWRINDQITLLENTRFYPGEEKNDPGFSEKLSNLGQVFVNEAFATSHREHASTVGITKFLASYAGFRFLLEVETLSKVIENPKRPLVVIIGGEKIETKLPLVEKMHSFADDVLIGGKIAEETKTLLEVAHSRTEGKRSALLIADVVGTDDITDMSVENFIQIVNQAKTIVWNGTMGNVNIENHQETTKKLAKGILEAQAFSVVGGGDTVAFLTLQGIKGFSFISVGGGAMLAYLAGENLPALTVLKEA